ncbi:FAD-binding protein [Alphaproteobacteria bacterium]|nr:FAD-binding protein [Alphaproteobacteria bacterium]
MKSLIIAENYNNSIRPAVLNVVTAAKSFNQDIDILVVGKDCKEASEQASKISGVSSVLIADHEEYKNQLAENLTPLIVKLSEEYQNILSAADTFGKNLMPRVAAILDVMQISDVMSIESNDTFIRPIYAGNAFATVQSIDAKKILTIRTTAFEPSQVSENSVNISNIELEKFTQLSEFIGQELSKSERPELTSARIIISGGRGMQSGDNFPMLEKIADKLGAAVGASRAAVDAGFVPNDYQVGQTGKIVAPELYIAVGISGAIQHLAGMKDSKVIVAINKDEEAPIFQISDYGIVGDLFKLIPELESELDNTL